MAEAVIVSAVRTPIGKAYRGSLVGVDAFQLAEVVVAEALKRSNVAADDVDDLLLGEVLQGGGDIARHAAVRLGLGHVPGAAVNRHCASGMTAVQMAAADIRAGMTTVAIAGGTESMTCSPQVMQKKPFPYGGVEPWISPSHPDTPEAPNLDMGTTVGENTAAEAGITREDQDAWALRSHQRAVAAQDSGRFDDEIVAVEVPDGRGGVRVVDTDDGPRRDTSAEQLAALRPIFQRDGTVTAGNSSPINDGAAALVVTSGDHARDHGLPVLATIRSWASAAVEPRRTGLAPTVAVPLALQRAGLTVADVDLAEVHEAFAAMAVACTRQLGFDEEIVNVNGGGVALGHPVACTGARILVTLIHELRRRGGGTGVATMCAGGGMAGATVIEVPAA